MKLLYTGSDFAAQEMWQGATNKQDFINHIYEHTQVTHDLDEAILVDTQGNMNLLTVYDSDGTIRMVGGESGETDGPSILCSDYVEDGSRNHRKWKLEALFDEIFIAAIQSGLLIEKAAAKACEAVEGIEQIEQARNRVVSAQLDKEFGDVER